MNEAIEILRSKGMTDDQIAAIINSVRAEAKNTYKLVQTVRLFFAEKPSKELREGMAAVGYHWNGFEKFWFADATAEALKFAQDHGFVKGE